MRKLLHFCQRSIVHLESLVKENKTKYLLIGVKGGGCNGLKYYIEPTNTKPSKSDELMTIGSLNIIICGKSLLHLLGTQVSWRHDGLGARLEFENPNAGSTCGCGETFSPNSAGKF